MPFKNYICDTRQCQCSLNLITLEKYKHEYLPLNSEKSWFIWEETKCYFSMHAITKVKLHNMQGIISCALLFSILIIYVSRLYCLIFGSHRYQQLFHYYTMSIYLNSITNLYNKMPYLNYITTFDGVNVDVNWLEPTEPSLLNISLDAPLGLLSYPPPHAPSILHSIMLLSRELPPRGEVRSPVERGEASACCCV